jgi:diadenosine tetraphosphate (Ap4A) HIT family hydrolase
MQDWRRDRIGAAEMGANPMVIARMESGFAVVGDTQFLPGYCVLLAAPQVDHLSDLDLPDRTAFLRDMSLLGEAIERACAGNGLRRVNYEILGNTDTYLHAHIFPRYEWEPAERRRGPVFLYPRERWTATEHQYDDRRHGRLRATIGRHLAALIANASQRTIAESTREEP